MRRNSIEQCSRYCRYGEAQQRDASPFIKSGGDGGRRRCFCSDVSASSAKARLRLREGLSHGSEHLCRTTTHSSDSPTVIPDSPKDARNEPPFPRIHISLILRPRDRFCYGHRPERDADHHSIYLIRVGDAGCEELARARPHALASRCERAQLPSFLASLGARRDERVVPRAPRGKRVVSCDRRRVERSQRARTRARLR